MILDVMTKYQIHSTHKGNLGFRLSSPLTAGETVTPNRQSIWSFAGSLKENDDRSVARVARVCKLWSDIALDALWHTVTNLRALLNLLGPIRVLVSRGLPMRPAVKYPRNYSVRPTYIANHTGTV